SGMVTLDTATHSGINPLTNGYAPWQHTTGDHPNRILIVAVNGETNYPPNAILVTYNGIPLTRLMAQGCTYAVECSAVFYYLKNPPVGTYTIQIDPNNMNPDNNESAGGAATFYNVDLTN